MIENRLAGADFVRALACAMVLGHHLIQRLSPQAVDRPLRPLYDVVHMGSFGVAVFFVLSGFLLARPFWLAHDAGAPMPSLRIFALRRAARILPGYWLALTVTFILCVVLFRLRLEPDLWIRYIAGVLLVGDFHFLTLFPAEFNGPLWSIPFEVTSYVLLPFCLALVFVLRPRFGVWGGRIAWVAVIAGIVGVHYLVMRYWPVDGHQRGWQWGMVGGAKEWVPRYNPIGFFAMFAIGTMAAALQVQAARFRNWAFDGLVVLGFAVSLWTIVPYGAPGDGSGFGWLNIPYGFPAFPLGIALVLLAAPSSRIAGWLMDNPPARYIARISFGIYVWHYLIIEVMRHVWAPELQYQHIMDTGRWLQLSAIIVGLSVLFGHVSYYVLEAPVIRWARGLEKRKAPPPPEAAPAASAS